MLFDCNGIVCPSKLRKSYPLTEGSLATIIQNRPEIMPIPVTIPPELTSSFP